MRWLLLLALIACRNPDPVAKPPPPPAPHDAGIAVVDTGPLRLVGAGGLYARLARLQFEAGAAALGIDRAAE